MNTARIFLLLLVAVVSLNVYSLEWESKTEIKYKKKNPELYAHYTRAKTLLDSWNGQQNVLIEADGLLKMILGSDDRFAPAYREYGRLYIMAGYVNSVNNISQFQKGSLGPAEQSILTSIEIESEYAESYSLLGHLYTNMRIFTHAKTALKEADRIGTEDPWLDINWATLLLLQGNGEEAFLRYQKVISKKVSNKKAYSGALEGIKNYYESIGDFKNAKDAYKNIIEFDPENAWAWGNYANFLLYRIGDYDEAIKNSEKALEIMNYGVGRLTLACALYTKWAAMSEAGDKEASAYFEKAFSFYPDIPGIIQATANNPHTEIASTKLADYMNKKIKGNGGN